MSTVHGVEVERCQSPTWKVYVLSSVSSHLQVHMELEWLLYKLYVENTDSENTDPVSSRAPLRVTWD